MHSQIWGKSDVICYWCILEFKSSLIQTEGWIEGIEERQKESDSSLCQYFTPSPLSQHSHERQKSTYPKFDLTDTPRRARTRRFISIFTKACHWNHHAPDEFSPTYSNNIILRAVLIFSSNPAHRFPNALFTFGLNSWNVFAGQVNSWGE
jgi:hypothetical protein